MNPAGTACAPRSVTVMNIGGGVLPVSVASITGVVTHTCSRPMACAVVAVAVGQSCSIQVRFGSAARGGATAALRVVTDAATSPDIVALAGDGFARAPAVGFIWQLIQPHRIGCRRHVLTVESATVTTPVLFTRPSSAR